MSEEQLNIRLGVDIGGNDIKFGATNFEGDKILLPNLVKRPSLSKDGPQQTIGQILDGTQEVLEKLKCNWSAVSDIAVTVPCPCTADGVIIEATNLGTPETKSLWQVPFGEHLAEAVKKSSGVEVPVFACNDANAAGQDDDFERYGLDVSTRTNVFITTGTGLGGCLIVDGRVFFGRGQAGELGHVKPAIPAQYQERFAADQNPPCGCSAHQCVESRASLQGLIRRLGWALSSEGLSYIEKALATRNEKINKDVIARLQELYRENPKSAAYEVRSHTDRDKDSFCRFLLEEWAILIGALFANLAPVLHPDLFIIGGGLTEMSEDARSWFLGIVKRVFAEVNGQSCFNSSPENCEITWSVSRDQGWRGAILMAIRAKAPHNIVN